MAFSLDTFRNLLTGQKPEQTRPSFTPASGREVKPDIDKIMASVETAPISELQKHDQALIDRFNFICQDGRYPREARELSETIGRLYSVIEARSQGLEIHKVGIDQVQEKAREELLGRFEINRQEQAKLFPIGEYHLSHEQQAHMDLRQLEQENPGLSYAQLLEQHKTTDAQNAAAISPTATGPDNLLDLIRSQEENIRQEWQSDLSTGRQNEHDLETYFAGKVDQHNTLIELAVEANPKLQETLPPQINYEQLRGELQQQAQQKQQEVPAQAMAMEMAI